MGNGDVKIITDNCVETIVFGNTGISHPCNHTVSQRSVSGSSSICSYVRFHLLFYLFFTAVVSSNSCVFLSCRPFVVNTTFSTGLVGVEVISASCLGQLTVGV